MSKFVVLGGAGAMGQIIVRDLAEFAEGAEIVVADFNKDKAEELAKRVGKGKAKGVFADIKDKKALGEQLKGATIAINSTPYYFNVQVMEAALQAGCHYLDLGGLFHVTREQQKLNDRFKKAQLLAVLGMGAAPGMTNVMAAAGVAQLDTVESIDIVIGCIDFVEVDHPLCPPYALDTILDEYTKEPMVFENGQWLAKPPMSGEIEVDFPKPVGKCNAILTLHSEVATLPETYRDKGVKECTFRLGLPMPFHEKLKLLVDIGFGGAEKVTVDGTEVTPRKMLAKLLERFPMPDAEPDDCEVVRVDIKGVKAGMQQIVRLETTVLADKNWKVSCGALDTGVPPSIVAQMIAGKKISATGVLAPEVCVPPEMLFAELTKRSIKMRQEIINQPAVAGSAR
ncbi:MAG TPA: saccharopine dehydrogenase C-terminal domain-containing protein [Planktothrix sp.]|jgi:saccharopine dehydrogenase-like NADP-dependent oxidoreductase